MSLYKACLLSLLAFIVLPITVYAQDYSSSVSPIFPSSTVAQTAVGSQNYSYTDYPFNSLVSSVFAGSYAEGGKVKHNLTIAASNIGDSAATLGINVLYCAIGTKDCVQFSCDSAPSFELAAHSSKNIACAVSSSICAGRNIVIEYTTPGIQGAFVSRTIAKCPQSFCDQITMNMAAPNAVYSNEKVLVEGYLKQMNAEGIVSPIIVSLGGSSVKAYSNEFGYWRASLDAPNAGTYQLVARSESCNRQTSSEVQIFQLVKPVKKSNLEIYPKNIDVRIGESALLAVYYQGDDETKISISGVPDSWLEPSSFVMTNGIKFVYVSPASAGFYTLIVRTEDGVKSEKNVTLGAISQAGQASAKEANAGVAFAAIVFLLLLLFSKEIKLEAGVGGKSYLESVKKEIETSKNKF
ncbi:MAG: hypothetical protein V1836_03045 [Candidatus Aenigmatarchaeota archaeon]